MPCLEIHSAERRRRFEILDAEFSVGGSDADQLRLRGPGIGAVALRCRRVGDGLDLVPSTPGGSLVVNGRERPAPAALEHGDRVELGPFLLVFLLDGRPPPVIERSEIPAVRAARARGEGLDLRIDTVPAFDRSAAAGRSARSTPPVRAPIAGRGARREVRTAPRPAPVVPAPSRPQPAGVGRRSRSGRGPVRVAGMPRTVFVWNVMLVAVLVGYLLYRWVDRSPLSREPEDLIGLARTQWGAGDAEQALATLRSAREQTTDPAEQARIDQIAQGIRDAEQRLRDQPVVDRAREEFAVLERFVRTFLRDTPPPRPAARELVRRADDWLREFAAIAGRYDDVRGDVAAVEALRARYLPSAQLGDPDTAEDVLFAVDRLLSFRLRRYAEAITALQAFLASGAPADDARRVEARLAALRTEGPEWLASRRQSIERLVASDRLPVAISELRVLVDGAVPADWLGDAPRRLAELEARLQQGR